MSEAPLTSSYKDPSEWRILIPCAIRAVPNDELRVEWFYSPPKTQTGGSQTNLQTSSIETRLIPLHLFAKQVSVSVSYNSSLIAHTTSVLSHQQNQQKVPMFIIGQTFLAIEWPNARLAGRYLARASSSDGEATCDTNVIIASKLKLRVRLLSEQTTTQIQTQTQTTTQKHQTIEENKIKARGDAIVANEAPQLRVGQQIRAECLLISNSPVDSVRWLSNGAPVDDFAVLHEQTGSASEQTERVLSVLGARQVQSHEIGLVLLECFARNALGDAARAQIAIKVIENNVNVVENSDEERNGDQSQVQCFDSTTTTNALVLEDEPFELQCPIQNKSQESSIAIEWRRGKCKKTKEKKPIST